MRWWQWVWILALLLGPLIYLAIWGPARQSRGGRRKGGRPGPYI